MTTLGFNTYSYIELIVIADVFWLQTVSLNSHRILFISTVIIVRPVHCSVLIISASNHNLSPILALFIACWACSQSYKRFIFWLNFPPNLDSRRVSCWGQYRPPGHTSSCSIHTNKTKWDERNWQTFWEKGNWRRWLKLTVTDRPRPLEHEQSPTELNWTCLFWTF